MSYEDNRRILAQLKRASRIRDLTHDLMGEPKVTSGNIHRHLVFGLARRLKILQRNYEFFMGLIENGGGKPLSGLLAEDAQVHLNSFYVQLRGALDNIAWAFLHCIDPNVDENNRDYRRKASIRDKRFLSDVKDRDPKLADYITNLIPWFDDLVAYRDPIAHRVPIYTPPSVVTQEEIDEGNAAQERAFAAIDSGAPDEEIENAIQQVRNVGRYVPYIHREINGKSEFVPLPLQLEKDLDQLTEVILQFLPFFMVKPASVQL